MQTYIGGCVSMPGWARGAVSVIRIVLVLACNGATALEPDPLSAVLAELRAHPPKTLDDIPKEKLDLLRRTFTEYTTRLPSFRIVKSAIPPIFDRSIADAMIIVGKLSTGKSSAFVLDLFGKPVHVTRTGAEGRGALLFRVSVGGFLEVNLNNDVVVNAGFGDIYLPMGIENAYEPQCAIRPGRWERDYRRYERSLAWIADSIASGKCASLDQLSEDECGVLRLAFSLYFGAVRSEGPTDANVWSKEIAEAFCRIVPLCKGQNLGKVLDLFGKPTSLWLLGRFNLALTYRFAGNRQADLFFEGGSAVTEIVFSDVSEKK
jgi:hypothetical protein